MKSQKALGTRNYKWSNIKSQKEFFDNLYKKLNLKSFEDWYSITTRTIRKNGGGGLLCRYKGSKCKALKAIYPQFKWKITNWKQLPKNFWKEKSNIREYLDELETRLNIKKKEDWYSISVTKVMEQVGTTRSLLHRNGWKILVEAYPEVDWDLQSFPKVHQGYWNDPNNHLPHLESVAKKLNVKKLDDWYNVQYTELVRNGGKGLLRYYNNDKFEMLRALYPDYHWDTSLSRHLPHGHWKSYDNSRKYIDYIRQLFHIKSKDDWYRISLSQIKSYKGGAIAKGGLYQFLQTVYPDQIWDKSKFSFRDKRSDQRFLRVCIESLFPQFHILEDFKFSSFRSLYRNSGFAVEFDIFIPELLVAFEYQGEQHYSDLPAAFSNVDIIMIRDQEKRDLSYSNDVTVIYIPFWWDRSSSSLQKTISLNFILSSKCN